MLNSCVLECLNADCFYDVTCYYVYYVIYFNSVIYIYYSITNEGEPSVRRVDKVR